LIVLYVVIYVMVYFNRVCGVTPRPSENPCGCREVEEREQELPASSCPMLSDSGARQRGRSLPCIPLERVAWLSKYYVAANGRGQKESLVVRECTKENSKVK